MKPEKITINFSSEKLSAIKIFAPELHSKLEEQLEEQLEKIYLKAVPQTARLYIDEMTKQKDKSVVKGREDERSETDKIRDGNHNQL